MNEKRSRPRSLLFVPLSAGFFVILPSAGLLVIVLHGFDVLSDAYRHLGISPGWIAVILAAAPAGSTINIPVATLRAEVREISVPSGSYDQQFPLDTRPHVLTQNGQDIAGIGLDLPDG
jgi:uncharacterized membrane protein